MLPQSGNTTENEEDEFSLSQEVKRNKRQLSEEDSFLSIGQPNKESNVRNLFKSRSRKKVDNLVINKNTFVSAASN